MDGLFSLLLFAAFFYIMMWFGCGAHMVHGHGRHTGHVETSGRKAVDPVCGMEVEPDKGYTKMYEGHQYRLCSRACLDTFEASPQQYAARAGGVQ